MSSGSSAASAEPAAGAAALTLVATSPPIRRSRLNTPAGTAITTSAPVSLPANGPASESPTATARATASAAPETTTAWRYGRNGGASRTIGEPRGPRGGQRRTPEYEQADALAGRHGHNI